MPRESTATELPNEEVAGGSGGDAEMVAEEKESDVNLILRIICYKVSEFGPVLAKIRAILIHKGKAIKPNNGFLRYVEGV